MVLAKQNWKYAHEIRKMGKYYAAEVPGTQKVGNKAIRWGVWRKQRFQGNVRKVKMLRT